MTMAVAKQMTSAILEYDLVTSDVIIGLTVLICALADV